jgi:hypothetical protein
LNTADKLAIHPTMLRVSFNIHPLIRPTHEKKQLEYSSFLFPDG